MNGKAKTKDRLEVSSDQLRAELIEIKERVGALETIASISNRQQVEAYVSSEIKTEKAPEILAECEQPRTREQLIDKFKFQSAAALDYHLKPLRESDLIHQRFDDNGKQTFEWSKLLRGLPKAAIRKILEKSAPDPKRSKATAVKSQSKDR